MTDDAPTLPTRRLPRAGLDLTVLGLGGTGPGGLFRAIDPAASAAMVTRALAAGIRYADTAPFYGLGLSERIVGDTLRGSEAVLSTKVGRRLWPGAHPDPGSLGWPGALPAANPYREGTA